MVPALKVDQFRNRSDSTVLDRAETWSAIGGNRWADQVFCTRTTATQTCNQRFRGRIDVERKECSSGRETNRNGYSRRVVS